MMRVIIIVLIVVATQAVVSALLFYFFQEKVLFYPKKLPQDYTFKFDSKFEEINIITNDGLKLNALLFESEEKKGLVFYLHGNAGALDDWGSFADVYTDLGYDVLFLDYRGFGKSQGEIESQDQLFTDVQLVYNKIKERYVEKNIVVLGYSIGTCLAAKLAADNSPRLLILQAPYYSLTDLICDISPITPPFLVRYKLETATYLKNCQVPIAIFHGDNDNIIDCEHSHRLQKLFKQEDELTILCNEGHHEITENELYRYKLTELLY